MNMKVWLYKITPRFVKDFVKSLIRRKKLASGAYRLIEENQYENFKALHANAWKNPELPQRQLELNRVEIANFHNIRPFTAAVSMIKSTGLASPGLLDIGCSSGSYYEVFSKAGLNLSYRGCDYAEAFIKLAKTRYPQIPFDVCDATALPYRDSEYDIVLSSSCLQYVKDYPKAVGEAARVAKKFVIMHRLPMLHFQKNAYLAKKGYGVEMVEIWFNEQTLMQTFQKSGLAVINIISLGKEDIPGLGEPMFMKSYLCKKI